MNILQVLPALHAGGVEQGTLDIAQSLVDRGMKSVVISSGGDKVFRLEKHGSIHIPLNVDKKNIYQIWRNIFAIRKVIRAHDISLIHARSRVPAWPAYFAAKAENIPFITTVHGPYKIQNGMKKYYNSVMMRGHSVISISHFITDYIINNYSDYCDWHKVKLIHRGIDFNRFNPASINANLKAALIEKWRLPENAPFIVLPARLSSWKGQMLAVKALSLLESKEACLILVVPETTSNFSQKLYKQARLLGVENRLYIKAAGNDLPTAYSLADILLSASERPEAFGRVIVEGQAMQRVTLAPQHGGALEQINPHVTGFLYSPNSPESLAKQADYILKLDENTKYKIAEQGHQFASQHFSLSLMTEKTLALYQETVDGWQYRQK